MRSTRVFELFYLATPAFVVLDLVVGIPARVAGIPHEGWRLAYYALLIACWAVCRARPEVGPFVGLVESSVNLLLLLLSVLLPIWSFGDKVLLYGTSEFGLTAATWWNFAVSAPILIYGIKLSERRIAERWLPSQNRRRGASM